MPEAPRAPLARLAAGGLVIISALLATSRPTPAPEVSPNAPPAVRAAYDRAASEVLCYCGCARQTVRDCTCGVAFGLRDEFEARLRRGESADSIVAAYLSVHGEQARTVPPKEGLNLLAWFGPGIAILLAAAGTITVILIWSSRGRDGTRASPPPAGSEAAELAKRLEKELREFDA